MAISLLERRPVPPGDGARLGEVLAEVEGLLSQAEAMDVAACADAALGDALATLTRIESRATALRLEIVAVADRRRVADATADTGTDAWVARLTGTTRAQAAGGIRLARLLETKYAATREAFAAGRLRVDQVRVIVHAAEQAPAEATPSQVRQAEEWLVDRATGDATRSGRPTDARRLRQTARRMFAHLDADLADRHEAILLGRETRSAEAETFLTLHDNGNGTFSGRFMIPELHGQLLRQQLQQLTAPRRWGRDRSGQPVIDPTAAGDNGRISTEDKYGDALCELIEHLPADGWKGHAGNGTEVIVTLSLDALLTGVGAAGLDTGVAVTAGEARRLACGAGLVPAVLDGDSLPLDLGRKRRLHTATQRRALALLHDTCAVAGCERPFAWCEIHHRQPWSRGGPTDLDNGLPLCGHHHRRAHDPAFDLRRRPDGEHTFHRRT